MGGQFFCEHSHQEEAQDDDDHSKWEIARVRCLLLTGRHPNVMLTQGEHGFTVAPIDLVVAIVHEAHERFARRQTFRGRLASDKIQKMPSTLWTGKVVAEGLKEDEHVVTFVG